MGRNRIKRGFHRKGEYIWTAVLMDEVNIASTPQGLPVVLSADFSLTGAQSSGVTLMAIRGWLSMMMTNSTANQTAYLAICKKDEDESTTGVSMDPGIIDFYVNEDVLYTTGWLCPGFQTAVGERPGVQILDINVKARRKLKTGNDISLQVVSQGGRRYNRPLGCPQGPPKGGLRNPLHPPSGGASLVIRTKGNTHGRQVSKGNEPASPAPAGSAESRYCR